MIPVLITLPFAVFGMVFQLSFITVGKAGFGAALSFMGGVLNIVLDWLFVAIFHWGLAGGAVVDFFAKNNAQVETIALYGFRIVATSFLMMAYNGLLYILSILMSIFYFRKYRNMWSVKV